MNYGQCSLFFCSLYYLLNCNLYGQWSEFVDPYPDGEIEYAEWDLFTQFTGTTNVSPDVPGSNANATLTENSGTGFPSSTGNIYSFTGNTDFTISGTTTSDITDFTFQFYAYGDESSVINLPILIINGGTESLSHTTFETIYTETEVYPEFGTVTKKAFSYSWDLSNSYVNSYAVDFGLRVHTSLDKVRLDTLATEDDPYIAPVAPDVSISMVSGQMHLSFDTMNGKVYSVYSAEQLSSSTNNYWTLMANEFTGDGTNMSMVVTDLYSSNHRFYKVIVSDP